MKARLLILFVSIAVLFTGCNSNKTADAVKVEGTQLQAAAPDFTMMIVAKLSVKPDKIKDFTDVAKEMIEKSNKEAGCTFYQLYQDPYISTNFCFVEEYKNQAAVDAHFATDYFGAFGSKIADFITGPPDIKVKTIQKEVAK
jgi:quinol monooxygenase YgiN